MKQLNVQLVDQNLLEISGLYFLTFPLSQAEVYSLCASVSITKVGQQPWDGGAKALVDRDM
jgi:hypothetical protein